MATTIPPKLAEWYNSANKDNPQSSGLISTAGSTTVDPVTYNPTKLDEPTDWNVTKDQTAAGQLDSILSEDSKLMQLAATRGKQQANQRGLLNSSMGVGAAQDSVIAAATPIAQSDADVNARAAGYNADTKNTFEKTNAAMETEAKNFGAQSINRANEFNATNAYNKEQDLFEANVRASLAQIDNESKFDLQTQSIFGGMSNDFTKMAMEINKDVNMNQQSKDFAIKQLFDVYKAQMSMLSAVGSIPDVSQLLEPSYV